MSFNTTVYPIKDVDGYIDSKGGHWLYVITDEGKYYGASRDYPEGDYIKNEGTVGLANDIAEDFATNGDKLPTQRSQYIDSNGMPWIIAREHNYLTVDQFWAMTAAYKGSLAYIESNNITDIQDVIKDIASKNKAGGTTAPPKPYTLASPEPAPKDMSDAIQRAYAQAVGLGLEATEAQAVASIGIFESNLGVATPFLQADGKPSYNVGALKASSTSLNSFVGPGGLNWQRFPSMNAGIQALLAVPAYAAARAAWQSGDAVAASTIMFDRGYYEPQGGCAREDCIMTYAKGIVAADQKVSAATGFKPLLTASRTAVPPLAPGAPNQNLAEGLSTGTTVALAAGFGGILYLLFGRSSS